MHEDEDVWVKALQSRRDHRGQCDHGGLKLILGKDLVGTGPQGHMMSVSIVEENSLMSVSIVEENSSAGVFSVVGVGSSWGTFF